MHSPLLSFKYKCSLGVVDARGKDLICIPEMFRMRTIKSLTAENMYYKYK
jgi:hypothetical protein